MSQAQSRPRVGGMERVMEQPVVGSRAVQLRLVARLDIDLLRHASSLCR